MPLPRMTTRRWMIAVLVVAVAIAIPARQHQFIAISRYHQRQAGISVYYLEDNGRLIPTCSRVEEPRISPARYQWHRMLAMKYFDAGHRYPILPVPPDPPPPE